LAVEGVFCRVGAMKPITSNEEFFAILKGLIHTWCDRRALKSLSWVLGPYLAFNGLTDGWGELLTAMKSIRSFCSNELSEVELETLGELIRTAERAVYREKPAG
jgi:hypothetical protein